MAGLIVVKRSLSPVLLLLIIVGLASGPLLSQQAVASAEEQPFLAVTTATPAPQGPNTQTESLYFSSETITLADGRQLEKLVINGPPRPPEAYLAQRTAVPSATRSATLLPNFPSYSWVFGCSAVSGAMIAGYYDINGYPDMYTGPANGGDMPVTDSVWSPWTDGSGDRYPGNPLVASKSGLDGRTTRGSIEDYWVSYGSSANDPYITGGWTEHAWSTAIGDFMKTSQSNIGNIDGGTRFYGWKDSNSQLTCDNMEYYDIDGEDGTYGRKLFYEARGYTVGDCYNQVTDNKVAGGFSLADFKAEIDTGHPVLLNLQGHSVVGFGYDGTNVYIRDTWDSNQINLYTMPWGGCLQTDNNGCMELLSVSVVRLGSQPISPPADFGKMLPADLDVDLLVDDVTLQWQQSTDASSYEVCYDTTDDDTCSNWVDNGTSTSKDLTGLDEGTTYYWQVRAINDGGETYADGSNDAFWQFTIDIDPSGDFTKTSPSNGITDLDAPVTLSWSPSINASHYEVCYATSEVNCTNWTSNGTSTTFVPGDLQGQTTYYWQVRAVNEGGETYADGSTDAFWQFTTDIDPPGDFTKINPGDGVSDIESPVTLSWNPSVNASHYEICYAVSEVGCTNWISTGTGTSFVSGELQGQTTYYWQVRAFNDGGFTYANGSNDALWQFTTVIDPPGDFAKLSPGDGTTDIDLTGTLSWNTSTNASFYEVCYATSEADCTNWLDAEKNTTYVLTGLQAQTTYYWQVRAVNSAGPTYADGSADGYWVFTTGEFKQIFLPLVIRD